MPGADYQLTKLLGLRPSIKRLMIYNQGCFAGGTGLRLAKDLAENNKGSRVLLVCSKISIVTFEGPSDTRLDSLVTQALLGDGAAAVIVGADPDPSVERPIFQEASAAQTILPGSDGAISSRLQESCVMTHLRKDVASIIGKNIEGSLVEAFKPIGIIRDWNFIFWAVHPGGRAIVDEVETKLETTRHILSEYGNTRSASVLFILEEMRNKSLAEGKATTGEGEEWGLVLGIGPGISVEAVVLHSAITSAVIKS